jgi:hypothetical protein
MILLRRRRRAHEEGRGPAGIRGISRPAHGSSSRDHYNQTELGLSTGLSEGANPHTLCVQRDLHRPSRRRYCPSPTGDVFQFSDEVEPAPVQLVLFEDVERFFVSACEILMVPAQPPHQSFKVRGGANADAGVIRCGCGNHCASGATLLETGRVAGGSASFCRNATSRGSGDCDDGSPGL